MVCASCASFAIIKSNCNVNLIDDASKHQALFHHIPSFVGVGITSILPVPSSTYSNSYYVGTKRGKIKQLDILDDDMQDAPSKQKMIQHQIHDIEDVTNGKRLKPYPIFSMMSVPNDNSDSCDHDLLAGGGDRYVTVWRKDKENDSGAWKVVDQLGPHTGWVKDLASINYAIQSTNDSSIDDDGNICIFSIGCNCIEVWSVIDGKYQHIHKLQIDSSIEMGCTLSSDLLCLTTFSEHTACDDSSTISNYLFAGGVDGRIHQWTVHNKDEYVNAGVVSAHSERVNALMVCHDMNILVSCGSDKYIHCRAMSNADPSEWEVASMDISRCCVIEDDRKKDDTQSIQSKVTALCTIYEESKRAVIAAATSCGCVVIVNIKQSENEGLKLSFLKDISITNQLGEKDEDKTAVIHTLSSCKQYDNTYRILIGHSASLLVWDITI